MDTHRPPVRRCPICGQRLFEGRAQPVPGLPGDGRSDCPNRWCRRPGRGFSVAFSVGVYDGALRRAIGRYKYREERGLAPVFAGMIAAFLRGHEHWFEEFPIVTAVPSFAGAGARRSWDPVGTILTALAVRLDRTWTVAPGLVVKTAETPGLAGRSWADRQAVARGPLRRSLCPSGVDLSGAQVLLFDDVMTEGSTLREVAEVLRRSGASEVAALVLARPPWTEQPPARTAARP